MLREVSHGLLIHKYLIIIALVKTTGGLDKNDIIHECEERKVHDTTTPNKIVRNATNHIADKN